MQHYHAKYFIVAYGAGMRVFCSTHGIRGSQGIRNSVCEGKNQMSNRFENWVFDNKPYFKFENFRPKTKLHEKPNILIHFNAFLVPWKALWSNKTVARREIMLFNFFESIKSIWCKVFIGISFVVFVKFIKQTWMDVFLCAESDEPCMT